MMLCHWIFGSQHFKARQISQLQSRKSFPILCAVFCCLPSLIGSLSLLVSQSPITPSLYIHVVTCSLAFFFDISTHEDETTTMCQNINDAA